MNPKLKPIQPLTHNARIWVFVADGWVKLTLRRDQRLTWGSFSRDEEGSSRRGYTWEWDGQILREEYSWDAADCDGRISERRDFWTTPANFRRNPLTQLCSDGTVVRLPGIYFPEWNHGRVRCRDYAAEEANY